MFWIVVGALRWLLKLDIVSLWFALLPLIAVVGCLFPLGNKMVLFLFDSHLGSFIV